MHIAFLTPEFPHSLASKSGGLGTSIKNLAVSLIKEKVKVSIFVYGQKENIKIEEEGLSIYLIKQIRYRFFTWYFYRKFLAKWINRKVKEEKIDILEAPDWTGITAFMDFHCPLIIRLNGSDAYFCHLEERKQKFKNRLFEEKALKSADAIVSVSVFTKQVTKRIFKLKRNIPVIPNSIELEKFPVPCNSFIKGQAVYFGTIIRKKGVLELAEIFNELVKAKPDCKLVLIGRDVVDIIEGGSTLDLFFRRLSPQAKKQVVSYGPVNYDEIMDVVVQSEVVILPSFAEALPMSWLEAMAMEKPLVTSNIGWANEVMHDGVTGFTENPKDPKAFAAKVLQLMEDREAAIVMGKAARLRVVQNFSTEVITNKNIEFYKKVIQLKRH